MQTARERAREAWRTTHLNEIKNPAAIGMCNTAADAASDVWEPLLREAHKYLSRTTPDYVEQRIKEALGE